jgi:hypothetical protein
MQAPVIGVLTVSSPNGRVETLNGTRSVRLADPANPFSLQTQTDTLSINGRAFTSTYDATAHTVTSVGPEGRKVVKTLD